MMVQSICGEGPARLELARLLHRASSAYWGRTLVDPLWAGHAESLELLTKISDGATAVVEAYDRIQLDFAAAIQMERTGVLRPGTPLMAIPILQLMAELSRLAEISRALEGRISARLAHRPEDTLLRDTVEQLVRWCDRHGLAVSASRTLNSDINLRLVGPGGELIVRFFERVDTRITPATLYRVVRKLRRKAKPNP